MSGLILGRYIDAAGKSSFIEVAVTSGGKLAAAITETATDGTLLCIDDLAQAFSYNADGTLNYIQVIAPEGTYRQTYTYANGKVSNISRWVKQ